MRLKEFSKKLKKYFEGKYDLLKTASSDLPLLSYICIYLFLGTLCAVALDFSWSTLKLPGYGDTVFALGMRVDGETLYVGRDEIYEIVVAAIISSYFIGRKKYEGLVAFSGFIGGILIIKFTEYFIYPTYFNVLFFGLFLNIGMIGTYTFWLIRTHLKDVLKGLVIFIIVWVIITLFTTFFM